MALRWVRLDVLVASLCQGTARPMLVAALLLVPGRFRRRGLLFCILRATPATMRFPDAGAYHWCGNVFQQFLPSMSPVSGQGLSPLRAAPQF